jgi:hypothetical protein
LQLFLVVFEDGHGGGIVPGGRSVGHRRVSPVQRCTLLRYRGELSITANAASEIYAQ